MHTDARTLENGATLEGDLCIIGAGAAGISIALEWIGASRKVILLEGGGFDFERAMQDLYRGEIVGRPYFPLDAARLHYFGGTTGHWAGFCSPYDPIDFETRSWVPHSGWPIRRAELDPFYARAHKLVEIGPYDYDAAGIARADSARPQLPVDERLLWTKIWRFSGVRFGTKYRDPIVKAPNVHLYTHANVCEIEPNQSLAAVDGLRVRTLEGKEFRARARHYVLACCSIQNARMLLASNSRVPAGLGNGNDLVGRYFMEHLEMPGGELVLTHPRSMKIFAMDMAGKPRGELAMTAQAQRDHRLLNGTASIDPATDSQAVTRSTFQTLTPQVLEAMRVWEQNGAKGAPPLPPEMLAEPPASADGPRRFTLKTRQEQSPNPDSRVTLSRERDAMGMPRARLDWQLTALDKRSIRAYYELVGRELGRTNVGRVRIHEWLLDDDRTWPSFLSGGWHHMGTTRMHDDAKQGVVDAHQRVHGLANLHIAGASVYPTAGAANPTLTLIAMSLRLSDHLKVTLA